MWPVSVCFQIYLTMVAEKSKLSLPRIAAISHSKADMIVAEIARFPIDILLNFHIANLPELQQCAVIPAVNLHMREFAARFNSAKLLAIDRKSVV